MLEVALPGMPVAGRERAGVVADLDQVAEGHVGIVGVRLVPVIAVERWARAPGPRLCSRPLGRASVQARHQSGSPGGRGLRRGGRALGASSSVPVGCAGWLGRRAAAGGPVAVRLREHSAGRAAVMVRVDPGGERGERRGRAAGRPGETAGFEAAVSDSDAVPVGDGDADGGVGAAGGGRGEGSGTDRGPGRRARSLAGPFGQAEEGGEREDQVGQGRRGAPVGLGIGGRGGLARLPSGCRRHRPARRRLAAGGDLDR